VLALAHDDQVIDDYFAADFDRTGEMLMLVHGEVGPGLATTLGERLQRVGQKLPAHQKSSYTLVVGMRNWFFAGFRDLMREKAAAG
jgi:hypothetical protein